MPKLMRKQVTVEGTYYNFDERYNQVMRWFDDVQVITVHVLSRTETDDSTTEKYLVFYQEIPDTDDEDI